MSNNWTRRWLALVYYTCASHSGQGLSLITTRYWTAPKVRSVSTTALMFRSAINKIPDTGSSVPFTDLWVISITAKFGLCNLFFFVFFFLFFYFFVVLDDIWLMIFFCFFFLSSSVIWYYHNCHNVGLRGHWAWPGGGGGVASGVVGGDITYSIKTEKISTALWEF